jgi:hypothetical protein
MMIPWFTQGDRDNDIYSRQNIFSLSHSSSLAINKGTSSDDDFMPNNFSFEAV